MWSLELLDKYFFQRPSFKNNYSLKRPILSLCPVLHKISGFIRSRRRGRRLVRWRWRWRRSSVRQQKISGKKWRKIFRSSRHQTWNGFRWRRWPLSNDRFDVNYCILSRALFSEEKYDEIFPLRYAWKIKTIKSDFFDLPNIILRLRCSLYSYGL